MASTTADNKDVSAVLIKCDAVGSVLSELEILPAWDLIFDRSEFQQKSFSERLIYFQAFLGKLEGWNSYVWFC
jgi:hypothetical protein